MDSSHLLKPDKVKVNDIMAFVYYGKVVHTLQNNNRESSLVMQDLDHKHQQFEVCGDDLIEFSSSADQFSREEKVTLTKAAEILTQCEHRPFTVCFIKASGHERVLRGRLLYHECLMGRSVVEDLDIISNRLTNESGIRQVDHRHILYIICNNVKYIVHK